MNYSTILQLFLLHDSFSASSVRNRSASLPLPPYDEKTRGLKEPRSTSRDNSLIVVAFFLVFIAREGGVKFLV